MIAREAVLTELGASPTLRDSVLATGLVAEEVLVAVLRAPINPADLLVIDGRYPFAQRLPLVLGAEGVGEVIAVGPEVTAFIPGDRVLPLARGNWCSHRIATAEELIPVPKDLPLEQAAVARINAATAWRMLDEASERGLLDDRRPILINAGNSMLAGLVQHFAGKRGVGVIRIVRWISDPSEERFSDDAALPDRVRMAAGKSPMLAFDCVAGDATGRLAKMLDRAGEIVVFGHLSGQPCQVPSTELTGRGLTVRGFSLRPAEARLTPAALRASFADMLSKLIDAPPLRITATYGLDRLDDAFAAARSGNRGRVMLALDKA